MPWALIAMAAAQAGMSIYQSNEQRNAAKKAQRAGQQDVVSGQNQQLMKGYQEKRMAQGTLLGGEQPGLNKARQSSREGTVLGQENQKQSILGS